MNDIKIFTTQEIFRLRNILQTIGNISYSFSKINQKYPVDTLNEASGQEIIKAYSNLINEAKKLLINT